MIILRTIIAGLLTNQLIWFAGGGFGILATYKYVKRKGAVEQQAKSKKEVDRENDLAAKARKASEVASQRRADKPIPDGVRRDLGKYERRTGE